MVLNSGFSHIIKHYLSVHGLFMMRFCRELGLCRVIFLLILAVMFFTSLSFSPHVALMVYCIAIYVYNSRKRDRDFLKMVVGGRYKVCYFLLYMIIALPFGCVPAIRGDWYEVVLYPLIAAIVAYLPPLSGLARFRLSHPLLTKGAYEYVSGFRSWWVWYIVLLLVSVLGAYNGNMRIPKVMSIFASYVMIMFYTMEHRREYVLNYPKASAVFMFKIKNIVANNAVCLLPFLVLILGFERSMHGLYTCVMLYLISVATMASTLSFRILFGKQDVMSFFLITLFYVSAAMSVKYPMILLFYYIVTFALLAIAYREEKKVTRI